MWDAEIEVDDEIEVDYDEWVGTILICKKAISSPNSMFDHLLESSHRDDSNKWSNIGFDEEIRV